MGGWGGVGWGGVKSLCSEGFGHGSGTAEFTGQPALPPVFSPAGNRTGDLSSGG